VQFEITTRCNLRCAYCTNSILSQKQDVSFDRFIEAVDQVDLTKVDNIDFTGLGEPILHPRLPEMIRTVRHRGTASHIRLVTNGTLLTAKRFVPLCQAGLTSLAVSIDSMDPARFARFRGGARLEIVLRNLRDLACYRRAAGLSLSLKIKAVLIEDPYAEAAPILDYSARIGLDMPHFSCLDTRQNAREFYHESWLQRHWTGEDDVAFMQWADSEWSRLGGGPPRPDTELGTATDRQTGFHHPMLLPADVCRWAVDAAFIGAGGACIACCEQMSDVPRMTWGTLGKKSLAQIWQNEMLWGYRLPLVVGRVPSGCVGCSRAPEHGIAMDCVESPRSGQTIQPA
jgi:MoaA/NifB/PqqE/SkfB family radical SAM enzyme